MAHSETDYARAVESHLESEGYVVYKEVPHKGRIVDLYAVDDKDCPRDTKAIEVKRGLGMAVLEQATYWVSSAHAVYVAVPFRSSPRVRSFGYRVASLLGLGVYEVDLKRDVPVVEVVRGKPRPSASVPALSELYLEGDSGGNPTVGRLGRFIDRVDRALRASTQQGVELYELISTVPHTYDSNYRAARALQRAAWSRRAPFVLMRKDGIIRVYPKKT